MKYRVSGASRDLGHEMIFTVDAANQQQAESVARARGMFVSEVEPLVERPPLSSAAPPPPPEGFGDDLFSPQPNTDFPTGSQRCGNCNRQIGALETKCVWNDHIVCRGCYGRLTADNPAPIPYAPALTPRKGKFPKAKGPWILCANPRCGYNGPSEKRPKGSFAVALILTLLMFIPGILYWIIFSGYYLHCPQCGMKVGDCQ